jgi:hypothetical protein
MQVKLYYYDIKILLITFIMTRIKVIYKDNELTQEEINELNDIELEKISKANLFDKFYNLINISSRTSLFLFGIYLLWVCLHYF